VNIGWRWTFRNVTLAWVGQDLYVKETTNTQKTLMQNHAPSQFWVSVRAEAIMWLNIRKQITDSKLILV